ncbi:MAG TPA: hypothetical protein PKX48_01200 [Planctomycetota bacterium]|jgi:hypothetical protein|nr:hypothetical protein [Planctomycetota bacterium]OQC22034.1 MAG: hypothetical protein BWX69_00344 [Planctomycetes bacterium ADurb.Bin069]HNR98083.1 hypothetical protein [Planctomycetota bacterium]HNU25554.1 hypothetical protein [Planctomycetota bacterium]HOE28614.1 hypothetical protein [Planctomycetota bacterium]
MDRGALPENIRLVLAAARARARFGARARAALGLGSFALGLLLAEFLLDYHLDIPAAARAVLLLAALGAGARAAFVLLVRPLGALPDTAGLARGVEAAYPELEGRFLTAVQLSAAGNPAAAHVSPELVAAVVRDADGAARHIDAGRVYPLRGLRTPAAVLAVLAALWLAVALWKGEVLGVWWARLALANVPWPRSVALKVVEPEGSPVLVARGDDLMIEVEVVKGRARQVELLCDWDDARSVEVMTRFGRHTFRHTMANLTRGFTFTARGGDGRTAPVSVKLVARPRIEKIAAVIKYPAYAGRPDETSEDGSIRALAGSTVVFKAWARPRVKEATFRLFGTGKDEPLAERRLAVGAEEEFSVFEGGFDVTQTGYYACALVSEEGFANTEQNRYRVRAIPDGVPVVRIAEPSVKEECTLDARLAVKASATDDWGLVAAWFGHAVKNPEDPEPGPEERTPLAVEPGAREAALGHVFDLTGTGVKEGGMIEWRIGAQDAAGGAGFSAEHVIVVVRPEDLRAILLDRLTMVREDLRSAVQLQDRARERLSALARETREQATLEPSAAGPLSQSRSDAQAMTRRLEAAAEELARVRDRMARNQVADLKEQKWVGSLGEELKSIAGEQSAPLGRDIGKLAEAAGAGNASPAALPALIDRQGEVKAALQDVIDRMTEYGDLNQLARQLRDLYEAEERVKAMTREMLGR